MLRSKAPRPTMHTFWFIFNTSLSKLTWFRGLPYMILTEVPPPYQIDLGCCLLRMTPGSLSALSFSWSLPEISRDLSLVAIGPPTRTSWSFPWHTSSYPARSVRISFPEFQPFSFFLIVIMAVAVLVSSFLALQIFLNIATVILKFPIEDSRFQEHPKFPT